MMIGRVSATPTAPRYTQVLGQIHFAGTIAIQHQSVHGLEARFPIREPVIDKSQHLVRRLQFLVNGGMTGRRPEPDKARKPVLKPQAAIGEDHRRMRSTLICFALKEEAAPFRKIAAHKTALMPASLAILIVGIGRQNAEKSASEFLANHSPELVLTCGFTGGLDPNLKLGDVIFELSDLETRNPELAIRHSLLAAGAKPVKFFCADRIASTAAEKKQLREESGADAVEMESAAIHAVCRERGIPCVTIRVISDTAGEDLPLDFNALAKTDKSLDFGKLAWAIAKSPGKIGALMVLQKKTSFAARQLAAVLEKIIFP